MLSLQSNQSGATLRATNAMKVFITPDHDSTMINSDIVMMDLIMDDNELDVEIYDYLSGDDYADAILADL